MATNLWKTNKSDTYALIGKTQVDKRGATVNPTDD